MRGPGTAITTLEMQFDRRKLIILCFCSSSSSNQMGTVWLKNVLGVRQTDYELLQVPRPKTEFTLHVTLRCVQTGVLMGSAVGPLVVWLREQDRKGHRVGGMQLREGAVIGGLCGAAIGAAIGPGLAFSRIQSMSTPALYNKVYQLRFSSSQLMVDRASLIGGAIGWIANGAMGLVVGVDVSVIGAAMLGGLRGWW